MFDIKQGNLKDIFKNITDNLVKKSDGTYIFKNNKYQISSNIILGPNLKQDSKFFPSVEELNDYFEREIVSKIPHAILLIFGDLAIAVNIDPKNKYI